MRQNAQRREIVFHLLKSGQHRLPVIGHGLVVERLVLLHRRPPQPAVEKRLRQRRPHGPEAAWPGEPVDDRSGSESRRGAQRHVRIERRRARRRFARWPAPPAVPRRRCPGGARVAATGRQRESPAELAFSGSTARENVDAGWPDQQRDGVLELRAQMPRLVSCGLRGFELRLRLRHGFIGGDAGAELNLGQVAANPGRPRQSRRTAASTHPARESRNNPRPLRPAPSGARFPGRRRWPAPRRRWRCTVLRTRPQKSGSQDASNGSE